MKRLLRLYPALIPAILLVLIILRLYAWAAVLVALLLLPAIMAFAMISISHYWLSPETLLTKGLPLDAFAPLYDWYCEKMGLGTAFREETLRIADLKAGERVLDVGCGTGVLTRLASLRVGPEGTVTGIDPAARMIEVAQRKALSEGSSALFRLAVIEDLPFEDARFDCVLSSAMLHHLPPDVKEAGLREVSRVLKPGGRLVLVDVDKPSNPLWWPLVWPLLLWSFTRDQVRGRLGEILTRGGFSKIEKTGSWGGFLGFWRAYKPENPGGTFL